MYTIFQTGLPIQPPTVYLNEFWGDGEVLAGMALFEQKSLGNYIASRWFQFPGALNDVVRFPLNLLEGDYLFSIYGVRDLNMGINTFDIDGTDFLTVDWYAAGVNLNDVFTQTVTIAATGSNPVLTSTVTGQNGASSGFDINLVRFTFEAV